MTFKLLMDSTAVDPEVHLNMTTTQRDLATRLEEEQQPAGEMTEQQPGEQIADKQTAEGAETMLGSDSESNDEQMEQLGRALHSMEGELTKLRAMNRQQQQLSNRESEWRSRLQENDNKWMEKLAEHKSAVESITMQQLEESIAKAQQVETMMEQKLAKLQQDWECRGDEENSKQQQEVREIEQHDPKFATVMDSFDNVVAEHEKENLAVRRLI